MTEFSGVTAPMTEIATIRSKTLRTAATAALVALGLAGCAKHVDTTSSIESPSDYRDRHPIVIDLTPEFLAVYPMRGPGGLDRRQQADIAAFAEEYRSRGSGHIRLLMPSNAGRDQQQTARFVRERWLPRAYPPAISRTATIPPRSRPPLRR